MSKLRDHLLPFVKQKAEKYNLDWKLFDAIIQCESDYNFYAIRFEPHSEYKNNPDKFAKINGTTPLTEETLQKFSWGLFQLMGVLARDLGFTGPMPSLCDVDTNLELGSKFILGLQHKHAVLEDIIAAYNAGTPKKDEHGKYLNQEYVDKVMGKMKQNDI